MKKWIYTVMAAALPVLALSMSSCNDDDDLPNVTMSVNVENATVVDGTIYVVAGDTLNVTGINVINNDEGKAAGISYANYYLDYRLIGVSPVAPFGLSQITDENTPEGNYLLEIFAPVFAVDKELANAMVGYKVSVVGSADDIPEAGTTTVTTVTRLTDNSK